MPLSPLRLRLLVTSLLTVSFLGALDHTIVATSLATIAGSLGALEHMSWIIVGYTLASTVLLPVLGKLGDLVGPRAVFLWSVAVFLLASLACGFAQDMTTLIVARVVQGMSSSGIQLMSQTIIAQVTTPRQRPKYLSVIGAAFPIAILIGPVLGGLITDYWTWQWVFWINIPLGVLALIFALIAVPHIEGAGARGFDYAGTVTLTVALVSLVLTVTWIGDAALPAAIAFAVAIVGIAAFFWIELRVADPLVPLNRFRNRTVAAGIALSAIIGVGLFSVTAYLPTYFQMAYRTTATVSGLVPIATVFGMLISNLFTGFLASRTGRYRVFPIVGTAMGALGLATMAVLPWTSPLWVPMVVMFIVGVGTGSFMSLVIAVVQAAVPRSETGTITATINLVRQVGATVATALIGVVIASGVSANLPPGLDASTLTPQFVHGSAPALQAEIADLYGAVFVPIFIALALTYAVGVFAAIFLPGGSLSDEIAAEPARTAVETHSA
jgi:EmrB/QacA subfamily drug resistance transporter